MKWFRVVLVTLGTAAPLAAQLPDIGPPPGRLVDIGARKLHVMCTGASHM